MKPHQHPSNNDVLAAPPGVSIDRCVPLPITRVLFQDKGQIVEGAHAVASFWMPSVEEVERIVSGKAIRLIVWGRTHAPIAVEVDGDGFI